MSDFPIALCTVCGKAIRFVTIASNEDQAVGFWDHFGPPTSDHDAEPKPGVGEERYSFNE